MGKGRAIGWTLGLVAVVVLVSTRLVAAGDDAQTVGEKLLLDNDQVMVYEFVFPAGFRGEEHAAVANELAYVLDGQFTVVTRGRGRQVVHAGEVAYASKGDVHVSLNETSKPARVLVVIVKEP